MKKFLMTLLVVTSMFSLTSCGLQDKGIDDEAVRRTKEEMEIKPFASGIIHTKHGKYCIIRTGDYESITEVNIEW